MAFEGLCSSINFLKVYESHSEHSSTYNFTILFLKKMRNRKCWNQSVGFMSGRVALKNTLFLSASAYFFF